MRMRPPPCARAVPLASEAFLLEMSGWLPSAASGSLTETAGVSDDAEVWSSSLLPLALDQGAGTGWSVGGTAAAHAPLPRAGLL